MGNASGNAVAGLGNRCSISIGSSGSVLMFSFVKGTARRGTIGKLDRVSIIVTSSTAVLNRMIVRANCVARHGTSLANSITVTGASSLTRGPSAGTLGSLRKGLPNMFVAASNDPKKGTSVRVHKLASLGTRPGPLVMLSKLTKSCGLHSVGPTGVRSVRILGSTTSTDVCNSETTNNIVVVRAGGNGGNRSGVDCRNHMRFSG